MGCLVSALGFAFGFAFMFWLSPILAGWLDAPMPWWGHWLLSIVCGILGAGMAYGALEKSRAESRRSEEDEIIRRAQVKQAQEYLAGKDDDSGEDGETYHSFDWEDQPSQNDDPDDGKPLY